MPVPAPHVVRGDPPSKNATFPVGVPEAELTVAVYVTVWPTTEGLAFEVTVVSVTLTLWVSVADVDGPKSAPVVVPE